MSKQISNVHVYRVDSAVVISGKEVQQLPYSLRWECPDCAELNFYSFLENPLSEPDLNGDEHVVHVTCKSCGWGTSMSVSLCVEMKINWPKRTCKGCGTEGRGPFGACEADLCAACWNMGLRLDENGEVRADLSLILEAVIVVTTARVQQHAKKVIAHIAKQTHVDSDPRHKDYSCSTH